MAQEQVTPHLVAAQLAREPSVAFRIALEKQEETWRLHTLLLDAFPTKPGEAVPIFTYLYDQAAFLAGTIAGEVAATWLTTRTIQLSGMGPEGSEDTIPIPPLQEHVTWQRYPRNTYYGYTRVPWPHTRYELPWPIRTTYTRSQAFLVSDACPFFPNFQAALYDLVYGGTDPGERGRMSAEESCIVRIAHPEAWLEHIHISATALTITVAGIETEGAVLEISGPPTVRWKQQITSEGTVTYPLSTPLPDEWWVMLSRGSRWLDYYQHYARYSAWSGKQPHVTTEQPRVATDPAVLVQGWVAQGEGQQMEYKLDASHSERFLQSVAAFANGAGGIILIGVPNHNPSIVGYPGDVDEGKRRLISTVRDNLTDMPPISVEDVDVESKIVLIVSVEPGDIPPYGIKSRHPSSPPTYYVRHGSSNYIAQSHEINAMVRQQLPVAPSSPIGALLPGIQEGNENV